MNQLFHGGKFMHTLGNKRTIFNYNSDFSGDIKIVDVATGNTIEVASDDLLYFVADFIRSEKISKLEQMSTKELLGI